MPDAERSTVDRLAATLALEQPVTSVRQVSPARQKILAHLHISSVRDLVTFYPYRYIDLTRVATIADAPIGEVATISGEIYEMKLKRPRYNLPLVEITLVDGTDTLIVTCFHQQWLMKTYQAGQHIAVAGKVEFNYGFKRMTNPFIEEIEAGTRSGGFVLPLHHATEKLSAKMMRRIIRNGLDLCRGLDDPLPLDLRVKYRLVSRQVALENIHFPPTLADAAQARRRLAYEELFFLEVHLKQRNLARSQGLTPTTHVVPGEHLMALTEALPFTLTEEQEQARDELLACMAAPRPANHLLLGDVGTGKTAVASFGLAAVADTGTQAMMMAPTEVLARQYGQKLGPLLDSARISWGVLTASTPADERERLIREAGEGTLTVLFGTQALLEEDVVMPRLSFVVIDEQQRFGVAQRKALVSKGRAVDVLSMTATPIPRSLALTIYGDMTLSYLHHRPRNAAGSTTVVCDWQQKGIAYDAAKDAVAQGRQVYVVCPLVGTAEPQRRDDGKKGKRQEGFLSEGHDDEHLEADAVRIESDSDLAQVDAHTALEHAEFLQEKVFCDATVGVLHGRLTGDQKEQVMDAFRRGEIQVLVATTVIEVGVDVPNATVMIIEDADRFGLAQLHQLRGRVGRGDLPGQVFLISDSRAPVAVKRLQAMERTQDGFELSEYDLSLRREGDILGNRQHGASTLKLVNIIRDRAIVECANRDAAALLADDPALEKPEHAALARELRLLFSEAGES
ncbi:MAG: ATP-dependent DNA helicase RecG [Eggerthellaceae bacterium]|jgi:ATP-dependent DNA helicase RecG